ncbi:MAG TPA: SPOR domain-containing protein, partial [Bacteroidales bacterium]|nr:SPOR domain-containing protein [Bacteroidales bacterium]
HLDSYGLESFRYQQAEHYDVRKRISSNKSDTPVRQISIRKYLWRAAVLVPVAGVLFALSLRTDLFKARVETTSMNPLVTAEFEDNKAAVENENAAAQVMISDSASAEKPVTEVMVPEITEPVKAEEVTAPVTESGAYYIITGSFQSETNAGKQVIQLQAEGFNPEVVQTENGFYRVCAMVCPDLKTAVDKKDSILQKFPSAWVSRKK